MKVIRGLPLPDKIPTLPKYNFDTLKHGDALIVANASSCIEMFRRWRRRKLMTRNDARLIDGGMTDDGEYILFFMTNPIHVITRVRAEANNSDEI